MSDVQQQIIQAHEARIRLLLTDIERLKVIEKAAIEFWAVVRRTDAHHEWLESVGKLGRILEHARKE